MANRLDQVNVGGSDYNLSVPFITGTGNTAGTWLGSLDGLTEYYDGLLILYKPSVAGASTTTLKLNSLDAKTVYLNNTTKITTHYPANQPIMLVYSTSMNSGCWMAVDNYIDGNNDTKVRQTLDASTNKNRPILLSYADSATTTGNVDNVSYRNNSIYANPSTGTITATKLVGDISGGTGLTSSQVTTALGYTPYNSTNPNGYTSNTGTITSVKTTAGTHTTINVSSGAANFNVPTKTSHLTNDSGFLTSHQTIKQDGVTGATINRFGTCSTAAGTAAKEVSITTGTFSLEAGATIAVKFSNANTAGTPTLNVNSKGAKNIFVNGAQITTGGNKSLLTGTVIFVYDGTQWHLIGNYYDTNTQAVTGVKGNSESSYRTGNVNITAANVGAATSDHTHTTTIAADSGTSALNMAANTTYKLTAGGSNYIFKTPADNDTKNTAGSTDTSSKIFLIGATSQAANPQTYSDNEIYATSGVLTTKSVQVGGTAATIQYNSTNKCIDFIFA